ncbi:MAG: DUF4886 domain-containing protein [Sphingobacteriales bacterium]|nr:DUF4886 domain-containing protein [Sphingobacteriales bacterium]
MFRFFTLGLLFICLVPSNKVSAQTKRVLFIGNSYIYVNNLPQTLRNLALSNSDTVVYDSSVPGGYTLELHSTNATTLNKIATGNWDFVVLQEQSQRPAFSPQQVETEVYPYAQILNDAIETANPCTQTVFYMTWGRKNGDASNCPFYPPICTYTGMQQRLRESYLEMATDNNCWVAPVGAAWQLVRTQNPSIELYNPDQSHPSVAGTYLIACVFYATLFQESPVGLSYTSTLSVADAAILQQAAAQTVLDSLSTWRLDTPINFNANQISGELQSCNGQVANYSVVPKISGSTFTWTVAGGTIINGQGSNNISVLWNGVSNGSVQVLEIAP